MIMYSAVRLLHHHMQVQGYAYPEAMTLLHTFAKKVMQANCKNVLNEVSTENHIRTLHCCIASSRFHRF